MELLGREVRDMPSIRAIRDVSQHLRRGESRRYDALDHASQHPDDHPSAWRAAIVALGLLGEPPIENDIAAASALFESNLAAVILASRLEGRCRPSTRSQSAQGAMRS